MGVDTKLAKSNVLGVLGVEAKTTPPYNLDVGFYTQTASSTLGAAVVEGVEIQYADGQKVELVNGEQKMVWQFTTRRTSNWDGNKIVYHESLSTGGAH
jgi:hypothetical protein